MKTQKVENFISRIDEIKNDNKLDLSIGEDLSIALMNLISLEEHFIFSFIKTSQDKFLEFLEETREIRKRLLAKIVEKNDDSEKWCISKHLLATAMRLNEVGVKYLHAGNKKDAEQLFYDSFNTYSLFWTINGFGDKGELKKDPVEKSRLSKISQSLKKMLDCCKE